MAEYIFKCDNDMKNPEWKEQIVRCKDCRFAYNRAEQAKDYGVDTEPDYVCDLLCCIQVEPDGFCKWGEESDPGASPMVGGRSRFSDSAVRIGTEPRHDMDYSIFVTGTSTDAEPVRYIPERTCHMERDDVYPCADDGCKRLSVPEWTCSECECENIGMKPHYCQNCGAKVIEE